MDQVEQQHLYRTIRKRVRGHQLFVDLKDDKFCIRISISRQLDGSLGNKIIQQKLMIDLLGNVFCT